MIKSPSSLNMPSALYCLFIRKDHTPLPWGFLSLNLTCRVFPWSKNCFAFLYCFNSPLDWRYLNISFRSKIFWTLLMGPHYMSISSAFLDFLALEACLFVALSTSFSFNSTSFGFRKLFSYSTISKRTAIGSLLMKMYLGSLSKLARHFLVSVRRSVTEMHWSLIIVINLVLNFWLNCSVNLLPGQSQNKKPLSDKGIGKVCRRAWGGWSYFDYNYFVLSTYFF